MTGTASNHSKLFFRQTGKLLFGHMAKIHSMSVSSRWFIEPPLGSKPQTHITTVQYVTPPRSCRWSVQLGTNALSRPPAKAGPAGGRFKWVGCFQVMIGSVSWALLLLIPHEGSNCQPCRNALTLIPQDGEARKRRLSSGLGPINGQPLPTNGVELGTRTRAPRCCV